LNSAAPVNGDYAELNDDSRELPVAVQPTSSSNETYTSLGGRPQNGCVPQNDAVVAEVDSVASVSDSEATADDGTYSAVQTARYCSLHVSRSYEQLSDVKATGDGERIRPEESATGIESQDVRAVRQQDADDDNYQTIDETNTNAPIRRNSSKELPACKESRYEPSTSVNEPKNAARRRVTAEEYIGHPVYGARASGDGRHPEQVPLMLDKSATHLYMPLLSDGVESTAKQPSNGLTDYEWRSNDYDEPIECNEYQRINKMTHSPL
jgi:hypothetical protein